MGQKRDRQPKTKDCLQCGRPTEVAYRIRWDQTRRWGFVCPDCIHPLKDGNPHYTYGGTWKGSRH